MLSCVIDRQAKIRARRRVKYGVTRTSVRYSWIDPRSDGMRHDVSNFEPVSGGETAVIIVIIIWGKIGEDVKEDKQGLKALPASSCSEQPLASTVLRLYVVSLSW